MTKTKSRDPIDHLIGKKRTALAQLDAQRRDMQMELDALLAAKATIGGAAAARKAVSQLMR